MGKQGLRMLLKNNQYLRMVLGDLRENLPGFREDYATIVHGMSVIATGLRQRVA